MSIAAVLIVLAVGLLVLLIMASFWCGVANILNAMSMGGRTAQYQIRIWPVALLLSTIILSVCTCLYLF